jgi:hypothetical protein
MSYAQACVCNRYAFAADTYAYLFMRLCIHQTRVHEQPSSRTPHPLYARAHTHRHALRETSGIPAVDVVEVGFLCRHPCGDMPVRGPQQDLLVECVRVKRDLEYLKRKQSMQERACCLARSCIHTHTHTHTLSSGVYRLVALHPPYGAAHTLSNPLLALSPPLQVLLQLCCSVLHFCRGVRRGDETRHTRFGSSSLRWPLACDA